MPRNFLFALLFASQSLSAQQVVAPTPEPVGSARGENVSDYNISNSFETGYRYSLTDGNLGKYRSDVNYRNGLRLLGNNLTVNSRDGHGRRFDEIILNTLGLGNDPYQSATLRIQKNGLYRYDLAWRLNEYFNPGLTVANGQHLLDTRRRLQDHDLTLFPQAKLKFHLGYTRNSQTGPALTTFQAFDPRGDEFPLFADVRRSVNEYRLGGDLKFAGVTLTVLRRWNFSKEDTPLQVDAFTAGNNPSDNTTLSRFRRGEPTRGRSPGWLVNLRADRKFWAANGRLTYVAGRGHFLLDETAIGTDRFAAARNRQTMVEGNASLPVITGDFSLSFFPGDRLTVTNNTSVHHTRIDGASAFRDFNNATLDNNILFFNFLGIRAVTNSTDLQYRISKWLGFYSGYHFSTRRVRTIEGFDLPSLGGQRVFFERENQLHSGLLGIRLKPVKPFTISLDSEIGRADRPLTPASERNYHALGGRLEYKLRNLLLTAAYRQNYNTNSVTLSTYASRARNYSANASWTPRAWFTLDAGYMKLHLDTVGGVAFFAGLPRDLIQGRQSLYIGNTHVGNLGSRLAIKKRVDLYLGYTITRDTGDDRSFASLRDLSNPISRLLVPVQTFPLTFQSPLTRVSVRLHQKLRWNAGWQFYRYREDFRLFSFFQNYRAHTGYTSLLWSF